MLQVCSYSVGADREERGPNPWGQGHDRRGQDAPSSGGGGGGGRDLSCFGGSSGRQKSEAEWYMPHAAHTLCLFSCTTLQHSNIQLYATDRHWFFRAFARVEVGVLVRFYISTRLLNQCHSVCVLCLDTPSCSCTTLCYSNGAYYSACVFAY